MVVPSWWIWSGSGSWSWSGSWSRSRSRSWSRSGSGSRSRSWSRSGSRSGCLPPWLAVQMSCRDDTVGELARGVLYTGNMPEPFLDSLTDGVPVLSFETDQCYYIETFGNYYVGRVEFATATELGLVDAAMVRDTGRLHVFLREGKADGMECEPVGRVSIPIAYISAKYPWPHDLFPDPI